LTVKTYVTMIDVMEGYWELVKWNFL